MAWNKQTSKFIWIAVIAAIALVVILVVAQEDFVRNAGQGIIDWVCNIMNLPSAPQIF